MKFLLRIVLVSAFLLYTIANLFIVRKVGVQLSVNIIRMLLTNDSIRMTILVCSGYIICCILDKLAYLMSVFAVWTNTTPQPKEETFRVDVT